jgi:3-hydroxymyristoyl/3-hydroxydecanoyl-(acyl carrier protein) dehydratase
MPGLKLTALKGVKFLGAAQPGEVLQLSAKVTGRLANLVQAEAVVRVDGRKIMVGLLTLSGEVSGIENTRPTLD